MSAWKPGDVAMVMVNGREVMCTFYDTGRERAWYHGLGLTSAQYLDPDPETNPRPLVVIDPEDREQVERLSKAMHESDHIAPWHDLHHETRSSMENAMQAALRSLLLPPRPDEPLGLGAVVEDEEGDVLVRVPLASNEQRWFNRADGEWFAWEDLTIARIVHEGVTA